MKVCSHCQTTYTDDSLLYCLQDGNPLSLVSSSLSPPADWHKEAETVIKTDYQPIRVNVNEPQNVSTQQYSGNTNQNFEPTPPPQKSKAGLFLLLGILGVIGVGTIALVLGIMYLSPSATVTQLSNNQNSKQINSGGNSNSTQNTNAETPTPTPTATPTPKPTLKPAEIESAKKEAESAIYGWKASAENHSLDTNMSSYADTVDYYKGGKISKSKVRSSKEPAYKKYDSISIDISNMKVNVEPTGEKATVTFDKTWDFSGYDKDGNEISNSGSVQQQIVLNRISGKWKIVSEKDVKVYYVDKGSENQN